MLLTTQVAELGIAATTFTIIVPGHQRWLLRSVFAVASRQPGGAPARAYLLTVTDGTNTVAQVGADDAGTEPGTGAVTWANAPAASVSSGSDGVSLAPIPALALNPGYMLVGEITNPAVGDVWVSALAWFDFAYTD